MMELWPFTNFHDLNLDWIIKTILDWVKKMQNFINQMTAEMQNFINRMTSDWDGMRDDWTEYQNELNAQWQEFIDDTYQEQITEILEDHPEWVTTVMDGALTEPKLNTSLSNLLVKNVDTVSDMVALTNLRAGDMVHTRGYYAVEDGGDAFYLIVNTQPTGIWYESLNNNLYAAMLYNDPGVIDTRKHGVKSDGVTDDSTILQNIINFYASLNKKFFLFTGVTYLANSVDFSVIGNDINIKGVGTAESQIKLGAGASLLIEKNTHAYNIRIQQITIIGSADAPLIKINHYVNVYFNDVSFEDGAASGFIEARNTGLMFFDGCNLDGYGHMYTDDTKPVFIDYYSAYISITKCNIYHLKAVVKIHGGFTINFDNNWCEDNEKMIEIAENTNAPNSALLINGNHFLKNGGEFYLVYSASNTTNLTNLSIESLGNRYVTYNLTNTYLTYLLASFVSVILADTDYHTAKLINPDQVASMFYRTFIQDTEGRGPKASGYVIGARKICLAPTFHESLNTLYAENNALYFKDGNGTLHQITMS